MGTSHCLALCMFFRPVLDVLKHFAVASLTQQGSQKTQNSLPVAY